MTLTKTGAGTQALNAGNTYSGNTVIKAGTLALGASGTFANSPTIVVGDTGSSGAVLDLTAKASSFTFSNTQTVKGIGTINIGSGKTVTIAGILAPGNSIGTINETDRTAVTGNLTLTGSTLQLIDNAGANGNGTAGAGAYRLMTFTGIRTGTFGTVTNPMSSTLHESVVYYGASNGTVDLNLYRLGAANTITTPINLTNVRVGGTEVDFLASRAGNVRSGGGDPAIEKSQASRLNREPEDRGRSWLEGLEKMGEHFDAGGDVFRRRVFVLMMAESLTAADEEHGNGADF